jgi:ABC-type branched-subunit amino acid transport system ATPase component
VTSGSEVPRGAAGTAPPDGEVTPILESHDIRMEFNGVHALDGVTVSVSRGEIVGLVGPNGSGKSTLINVLTGMFVPTGGRVVFEGSDISGEPPHVVSGLGMARTYQIPRPFESMTVLENVAFSCMFRSNGLSLSDAIEAGWEYLEFTGLSRVAQSLPSQINLHQRKFLELARALATQPKLLMLDEVLSGLNATEIDESVKMIRKIHGSGVTLVVVEHLMRVVTELASRMIVLNYGRLLAEGPPLQVMRDPEVVKAYLGKEHA